MHFKEQGFKYGHSHLWSGDIVHSFQMIINAAIYEFYWAKRDCFDWKLYNISCSNYFKCYFGQHFD